jgi:hypothetical protein
MITLIKRFIVLVGILSVSSFAIAATNNVQLPTPSPGSMDLVGRYSTVGKGIPSLNNSLSVQLGGVRHNNAYLSMEQSCIGDVWPDGTALAGQPVQGGVLQLNVSNIHNISEAGRLPWAFTNPLTDPNFAFTYATSTAGCPEIAKLHGRVLMAVRISGDNCVPRLGFAGNNGIELWDITNPNPTKAKLLSFLQVHDINPNLAALKPNGHLPGLVHFFSRGSKDYMVVSVAADLGTVQFFDITNPTVPQLVGAWGPEQIQFPGITPATATGNVLTMLTDYTRSINPHSFGFNLTGTLVGNGAFDVQISAKGKRAYVTAANAGLILLDIGDFNNINVISVAKDFADATRAEFLSSEGVVASSDGKTVVEGAGAAPEFTKFILNNTPSQYVPLGVADFTPKVIQLPGSTLATHHNLVYLGDACDEAVLIPSHVASGNQVALIRRGSCSFQQKAQAALDAGYSGFIVINSTQFGEAAIGMGGASAVSIPGISVPYYEGLQILNPSLIPAAYPTPRPGDASYPPGLPFLQSDGSVQLPTCRNNTDPNYSLCFTLASQDITVTSGYLKWTGFRIWDYSDLRNPVLVSTLDTFCSNHPADPSCVLTNAAFSAEYPTINNLTGSLYLPWNAEGVLVVDINNPAKPKYKANFKDLSTAFVTQNGGVPAFNRIIRTPLTGCLFTADAKGGLYVFQDPLSSIKCGEGRAESDQGDNEQ